MPYGIQTMNFFMQNKPKLQNTRMNLTHFSKKAYNDFSPLPTPKNKPKTKPNKPKQTQFQTKQNRPKLILAPQPKNLEISSKKPNLKLKQPPLSRMPLLPAGTCGSLRFEENPRPREPVRHIRRKYKA